MGYTHYYTGSITLDEATVHDVKTIINTSDVRITGTHGTGNPIVTPYKGIGLNGDANAELDADSLVIRHGDNAGCVKTNRQPYDAVVGAILLLLEARHPDFELSSDGTNSEFEWIVAHDLYESALHLNHC